MSPCLRSVRSPHQRDNVSVLGLLVQGMLLCLLATDTTSAQKTPSAVITGHVVSATGGALAGVAVSLMPSGGGAPLASATTDATGQYRLPHVSYGGYVLHVALARELDQAVEVHAASVVQDLRASGPVAGFAPPPKSAESGHDGPLFRASGVQGTIAPSGYSGGASDEDAEQLRTHSASIGLDPQLLIGRNAPACDQQQRLRLEVTLHPDRFQAQYDLGSFALAHGDDAEAARSLFAAKRIQPGDAATDRALAATYLRLRRYAEARMLLDPMLAGGVVDAPLLLLSAEVYSAQGMPSEARRQFIEAGKASTVPNLSYAAGVGLLQLDLAADAQGLFRQALDRWPGMSSLETGLGMALTGTGEKNAAAEKLLSVVRRDANTTAAYPVLARLTGITPELDRQIVNSIEAYSAAHPEEAEAHYDLAVVLWRISRNHAGPRDPIRGELLRALALDPARADAHLLLGVVDAEDGHKIEAVKELEASLKLTPGYAQVHYRLALVYRDLGRSTESDREMKRFLALRSQGDAMDGVASSPSVAATRSKSDPETQPCPEEKDLRH